MKVEVAVLGSPSSLMVLMVSLDVKQHLRETDRQTVRTELRSCVKVKVAVLGSLSVDVEQH